MPDEDDENVEHHQDHDGRGAPLSWRERRKLRDIIDRDEKARWLAASLRAWGAWIAAGLVAFLAFSDGIKRILRGWLS